MYLGLFKLATHVRGETAHSSVARTNSHYNCTFIIHMTISIFIDFKHHFVQFSLDQPLIEQGHDLPQLILGEVAVTILVKNEEGLSVLSFVAGLILVTRHDGKEFLELMISHFISILIHL